VLGINTTVMVVATVFLLGRLIPVQGINCTVHAVTLPAFFCRQCRVVSGG